MMFWVRGGGGGVSRAVKWRTETAASIRLGIMGPLSVCVWRSMVMVVVGEGWSWAIDENGMKCFVIQLLERRESIIDEYLSADVGGWCRVGRLGGELEMVDFNWFVCCYIRLVTCYTTLIVTCATAGLSQVSLLTVLRWKEIDFVKVKHKKRFFLSWRDRLSIWVYSWLSIVKLKTNWPISAGGLPISLYSKPKEARPM